MNDEGRSSILSGFRQKLAARRARKGQRTFVYCPSCKYEMVAGGDWLGQNVDDPRIEAYKCARCGTFAFFVPPEVRKTPVHQGVLKIKNSKMVPEQGNSLSERQEP